LDSPTTNLDAAPAMISCAAASGDDIHVFGLG